MHSLAWITAHKAVRAVCILSTMPVWGVILYFVDQCSTIKAIITHEPSHSANGIEVNLLRTIVFATEVKPPLILRCFLFTTPTIYLTTF